MVSLYIYDLQTKKKYYVLTFDNREQAVQFIKKHNIKNWELCKEGAKI